MDHAFVATVIGGGLEGCGPSLPRFALSQHHSHGADGAGRPPRHRPAMDHAFVATVIGGGLEGLRSLAAAGAPKSAPFHGADGADALQRLGQQMAIRSSQR